MFLGFCKIVNTNEIINSDKNMKVLAYLKLSKEYNYFYKLIKKAKYENIFMQETKFKKVLYLPVNSAFEKLPIRLQKYIWDENDNTAAKKIIRTHLYTGSIKQVFKDPNKKVVIINRLEANGQKVKLYSNSDLLVKDIVEQNTLINKNDFQIIPINCVMYLQPSNLDDRLSNQEKENSEVTSCCMLSIKEIDNFINGEII